MFLFGQVIPTGGTSAAAPAVAGFVALLNDARMRKGLPPLGFLNPLIYRIGAFFPEGFNDVTEGNNPGCGTPGFNVSLSLARVHAKLVLTCMWDRRRKVGIP